MTLRVPCSSSPKQENYNAKIEATRSDRLFFVFFGTGFCNNCEVTSVYEASPRSCCVQRVSMCSILRHPAQGSSTQCPGLSYSMSWSKPRSTHFWSLVDFVDMKPDACYKNWPRSQRNCTIRWLRGFDLRHIIITPWTFLSGIQSKVLFFSSGHFSTEV